MNLELTHLETRIIGCLIEKEVTTPDQYPLSMNALTNACNQKSNRDPVMDLDEFTVQDTVDELMKKHMVSEKSSFGSRARKFHHRFCNTEFGELKFSPQELGIICVLFLRGPQTPGELRSRSNRLCQFSHVQEVETTLNELSEREDGPFVVKLPREAGKRESRFAHLFSGEVEVPEPTATMATVSASVDPDRLAQLEQQVAELSVDVEHLKSQLEQLTSASQTQVSDEV